MIENLAYELRKTKEVVYAKSFTDVSLNQHLDEPFMATLKIPAVIDLFQASSEFREIFCNVVPNGDLSQPWMYVGFTGSLTLMHTEEVWLSESL